MDSDHLLSAAHHSKLVRILEQASGQGANAVRPEVAEEAFEVRRLVCKDLHRKLPTNGACRVPSVPDQDADNATFLKYMKSSVDVNLKDFAEESGFAMNAIELATDQGGQLEAGTTSSGTFTAIASDESYSSLFRRVRSRILEGERNPASDQDVLEMHLLQRKLWKTLLDEGTRRASLEGGS